MQQWITERVKTMDWKKEEFNKGSVLLEKEGEMSNITGSRAGLT